MTSVAAANHTHAFASFKGDVPRWEVLGQAAVLISNNIELHKDTVFSRHLSFFVALAVAQLLKAILLSPRNVLHCAPNLAVCSLQCLDFLMHYTQQIKSSVPAVVCPSTLLGPTARHGFAVALEPLPHLTSIANQSLGSQVQRTVSPQTSLHWGAGQFLVAWLAAAKLYLSTQAAVAMMTSSIAGLS